MTAETTISPKYQVSIPKALRDKLAAAGAQRIVTLGKVVSTDTFGGQPHDAIFPLHRMMKWIIDEGEDA